MTTSSPLGPLYLKATPEGLCYLHFKPLLHKDTANWTQKEFKKIQLHLASANSAISDYFNQGIYTFDRLPLDLYGSQFETRVWQILRQTKMGQTLFYSELANICQSPKAARAVGSACAKNPLCIAIPCHRVIPKNSFPGNYAGGVENKKSLLLLEKDIGNQAPFTNIADSC